MTKLKNVQILQLINLITNHQKDADKRLLIK